MSISPVIKFLRSKDELTTAEILLDTLRKYSETLEHYDDLGNGYLEIKAFRKAEQLALQCLPLVDTDDQRCSVYANLAKIYNSLNEPHQALDCLSKIESLGFVTSDLLLERTFSLFLLNRKTEAEQILRDMLADTSLTEDMHQRVRFNLGVYEMKRQNFAAGIHNIQVIGKQLSIWPTPQLSGKFWQGGIRPGETIVILAEGGIGDEIINVRFCKMLEQYGMTPLWYRQKSHVAPIIERMGIKVVTDPAQFPREFLWTYSMSLPLYLNAKPEKLWNGAYISATQESKDKFSWIQNGNGKKKVGIRWGGNPRYEHDLHRTVDFTALYATLKPFGFELYSLQRDADLEVLADYPDIVDLSEQLVTYDDTMGVISNLDFVISSCTSVAHVSAAMGAKTFVLVPISAYYIWEYTDDATSPWYGDNVTLCRQRTHKSWAEPLAELAKYVDATIKATL